MNGIAKIAVSIKLLNPIRESVMASRPIDKAYFTKYLGDIGKQTSRHGMDRALRKFERAIPVHPDHISKYEDYFRKSLIGQKYKRIMGEFPK